MSKTIVLGATGLAMLITTWLTAQPITQVRDQGIVEMINEVSTENLERNIRKLVGFHTRHSLSETASDERGIGAARRWILNQFESYAKESGGRLRTELDAFWVEADGRRIPSRVRMKNVLAF
ncbi:MAG: peptidase M28, partial [bacterium]